MTINWNCQNGQRCYVRCQLPDWAMLDGCFGGTKVSGSDIDGVFHQNGRLLCMEKKHPAGLLAQPQIRTIDTLVRQGNSVVAFWCESPRGEDTQKMRIWGLPGYDSTRLVDASLEDVRTAAKTWWGLNYRPGSV